MLNWVPVDLVEDPADLVPELLLELGLVVAHAERRQRHHPEVPLLDEPGLGCNSIDIWNLRLDLGHKLRQGLRTYLGTRFLVVG